MDRARELIEYLSQALRHPEVSGFELLEFLDVRSRLAVQEPLLSQSERSQLETFDRQLLQAAPSWLARMLEIGDVVEMRQRARALPSHWWWYLDEITPTKQLASTIAD
ncbi:MAG: hypothetical protein JRJ38_17400 [Deltaproteobacteria bacterium]|nr:hypothetical protein [Deltaproteobacteria bacterium]